MKKARGMLSLASIHPNLKLIGKIYDNLDCTKHLTMGDCSHIQPEKFIQGGLVLRKILWCHLQISGKRRQVAGNHYWNQEWSNTDDRNRKYCMLTLHKRRLRGDTITKFKKNRIE